MKKPKKAMTQAEKDAATAKRARIMYVFTLISFILPIVFIVIRMVFFSDSVDENEAGYHSKADYILMIVECLLGCLVINIPTILSRRFKFEIPVVLYTFYIIFLYCAIFLGEVRSFYYVIPGWDNILHTMSSVMLGFFGLMVVYILNRDEHVMVKLSPFFISLFAFSFAVTIGSLWEIYEFSFDGLLGLNMQKFMTADGVVLSGHDALRDTMKDIIVDTIGALASSTIGYFSIKYEKSWFKPKLTGDSDSSDADAKTTKN